MSSNLDETHDPHRTSWVESANGHPDFPIQNLPLGSFAAEDGRARVGTAIGDRILDLSGLAEGGVLPRLASEAVRSSGGGLNPLLALPASERAALRRAVSALLASDNPDQKAAEPHIVPAASCRMLLPARIGDYTDFYAGIHHATAVGLQFRPDNPLLPNYKYVPIGYHGRASSVGIGGDVRRPNGQRKPASDTVPSYGPSRNLDFELEFGIWVGPGNPLGEPIPIGEASRHVAGYCLLNDWSARDVQGWEYQPLGPFLAKSFATSVSPWIVTPEALLPFRIAQPARPEGDPAPLPYLADETDRQEGGLDVALDVLLSTATMRERGLAPERISASNTRHLYWTPAQMVTHHTSGGCNLNPGDLLGTGTISGTDRASCGSLLEASNGGREPLTLSSGETRRFLEDGDEVILTARASRDGFVPIGFGECRGRIAPALH